MSECVRLPPLLFLSEAFRQGAMPGEITDRQELLLWELSQRLYRAVFETGSIRQHQLLQLLVAWKGGPRFLGWTAVAPTLEPELRGPLAYVMGHRYLRLKRPPDATWFFKAALEDAPAGSTLETLAKAELDRFQKPEPAAKQEP